MRKEDTKEVNVVELTEDNHTIYVNGVKVVGVGSVDVDLENGYLILKIPAELGVR